ncbi:MAG: 50S ribosomal protein L21 [Candidatus Omnitrophica bacterium]|nr:50S ribosomal protein L21 [Candidatus Omnitrophota bacterium]
MYAIVEVGNKQYRIAQNDQILVEKAVSPRTQKVSLDKVLLVVKDKKAQFGNPYLKDARVQCEVVNQVKGKKKIAYKCRRRKSSRTKRGHRQKMVLLRVKEVVVK